jgi:hypothetical protein
VTKRYFLNICCAGCWALFVVFVTSAKAYEFPPYEGLSLKVNGQVAESYSTNVTYASRSEDRVEDFLTNFSLSGGLIYDGIRRTVELNGFLYRQLLTNKGTLENSSERIYFISRNDFSKYDSITISDTYVHTQVPGTLVDKGLNYEQCQKLIDLYGRDQVTKLYPECDKFAEQFGRTIGRLDSFSNTINLVYNRNLGERFNITAGYIFSQRWSPEEGATDSDVNLLRFGANYGLSAATNFSLAYSYQNSSYDPGSNINLKRVNAGIRHYITERLYVEIEAGKDFSSSTDSTDIEASVSGDIDKKTSVRIAYSRGADVSSETEDVFRNWRVSGNVKRELMEDLNVSFSGFYGQGDFVSANITDTFVGGSFDISYNFWRGKLGELVSGRMGYTYSNLDSTDGARGYSRTGLDAGLSVSF